LYVNGQCFISSAIISASFRGRLRYIKFSSQYKLYDKSKSKKPFVTPLMQFDNIDILGAIRSDNAIYDLKPILMGKCGR